MTSTILKNTGRFLLLLFLQVLVFNRIEIAAYYIPHIYILFIILLPFETPKWLLLVLSFLMGLFVDMFSYTVGLHTAACTLVGFLAPWVQTMIASKQEYEPGIEPGIRGLGFSWFLTYTLILVSVHHLLVYYLDAFRLSGFFETLYHAVLNIVITTAGILIIQMLTTRSGKQRV